VAGTGGDSEGQTQMTLWSAVVIMPGRKRPTAEDAMTARRVLLDGLARDAGVDELAGELESQYPRNDTFPGEVLLRLARTRWSGARARVPVRRACEDLSEHPDHPAP
jgi:hypothetical protein